MKTNDDRPANHILSIRTKGTWSPSSCASLRQLHENSVTLDCQSTALGKRRRFWMSLISSEWGINASPKYLSAVWAEQLLRCAPLKAFQSVFGSIQRVSFVSTNTHLKPILIWHLADTPTLRNYGGTHFQSQLQQWKKDELECNQASLLIQTRRSLHLFKM